MKIRFLTIKDLEAYRALRLLALEESPTAFGSSTNDEAHLPLEAFVKRLQPHGDAGNGVFGIFTEDGLLAGMLGFSREPREKRVHIASFFSMYVRPESRGLDFGAALVDHAIAHAKGMKGLRQIILSVTAGNEAACSLYQSRGFVSYGLERDALCINGRYFDEEHMVLFFELPFDQMGTTGDLSII